MNLRNLIRQKMKSLFAIEQELLDIYEEVEENGGEITVEQANMLEITKDNFKAKCGSYSDLIKSLQNDIEACKKEEDRIKALRKQKERVAEDLKKRLTNAILMFGDADKKGKKFIDLGTQKLYIRESTSVEVNDCLIKEIFRAFTVCHNTQYEHCSMNTNDLQDIAGYITAIIDADSTIKPLITHILPDGTEVVQRITVEDLLNVKVKITNETSILEMIKNYDNQKTLFDVLDSCDSVVECNTSKTDLKESLKECTLSVGKLVNNNNLVIK
jgi:hypothetical protein